MENNKENYEHKHYTHKKDMKDADAVAYAFVNDKKAVFFPYKQPELRPDEIRANILYAGLCLSDSKTVRSKWGPAKYPIAPGHEIIGEVVELGKDVKDFKKGDKVAFGTMRHCCGECKYCKLEKEPLCNNPKEDKFTFGEYWGGYSTQLQQPANFFFKLPQKLDYKRAAPLLCAGITMYNPIKMHLKKGMKTAVIGIGGLGHLGVQFLSKMGYEVSAVSSSLSKEKMIKELGANEVIDGSSEESLKEHNNKFDFIINTIPVSDNFEKYLKLTAPGGFFCQVGMPCVDEKISFTINTLVFNEITLVGSLVGSRSILKEMLELCADKDIYPMVEEFDFSDFEKAFDTLENGRPKFRCIVKVEDYAKKNNLK